MITGNGFTYLLKARHNIVGALRPGRIGDGRKKVRLRTKPVVARSV